MADLAEAALFPYMLVITFLGLLMYYLLTVRNGRAKNRYFVKKPIQLSFVMVAIVFSVIFIIAGLQNIELSRIFYEGFSIHEKYVPDYAVHYAEYTSSVPWMDDYRIDKTSDEDPLVIGNSVGFTAYVLTNELPQELVLYIFHEEMRDYLIGSSEQSHGNLTAKIDQIPHYNNYHSTFSLVFPLDETPSCNEVGDCHYDLNAKNLDVVFTKSGKYYAYFAVKATDGILDHHVSKVSLFTVEDPSEIWLRETTDSMASEIGKQRSANYISWGWSFLGIGVSVFFAVIVLLFSVFGRKKLE